MSSREAISSNLELLLSDFLVKYGERGKAVLEAAIRASSKIRSSHKNLPVPPGDFDYRSLVEELGSMGYSYNPSPILRILEREYGLIRTTLHTSRQRWYVFSSNEVREIIEKHVLRSLEEQESEDPDLIIARIQLISVMPERIKIFLKKLASKPTWSESDYRKLRRLSQDELRLLIKIYKRARDKESKSWQSIARDIEEILRLLSKIIIIRSRSEPSAHEEYEKIDVEELSKTLEEIREDL